MAQTKVADFQLENGRLTTVETSLGSAQAELTEARGAKTTLAERLTDIEANAGGGSVSVSQVTKLGVVGSVGTPYEVDIEIDSAPDFKRIPVEVLKFVAGTTNVVKTLCAFDNGDSTSFEADPLDQVLFDGKMHLKNIYQYNMTDEGALGSGKLWSYQIDKSSFKSIEKIEVV